MRRLVPSMRLIPSRDLRELKIHPDTLHLWNCVPPGFNIITGTPVDYDLLKQIPAGFPLRLFEVDREHWESELRPPLVAPPQSEFKEASGSDSNDRYFDLLDSDFLDHPDRSSSSDKDTNSFIWKNKEISVVTGVGPIESLMSCLDMLCKFHKVPFRRDIVERAAVHHLRTNSYQ